MNNPLPRLSESGSLVDEMTRAILRLEDDGCPHFDDGSDAVRSETSTTDSGINWKTEAVAKPVYGVLVAHQRSEDGWEHRTLASWLDQWWNYFNREFNLQIPRTALRLAEDLRRNCLGYFDPGYNEFGLKMEIAIRVPPVTDWNQLDYGELLGTLLHEQLHLAQEIYGTPGRNNYHNRAFRQRASEFGLIVNDRGHQSYAATSRFLDLLKAHNIEPPRKWMPPLLAKVGTPVRPIPEYAGRGKSKCKLKKWSCGCTNVRVAVATFSAMCLRCNRRFTLSQ